MANTPPNNRPPTEKERIDKHHQDIQKERDEAARKRKIKDRERAEETKARNNQHNDGGCFPKGTKISTPFGLCDISTLHKGDFVISINCKTGESQSSKILKKFTHTGGEIWLINFSDGSSIRTTSVHSFLINGKWKKSV